ncbi:membrane protein DedA, SNARE-associated domain [Sulfitobacter brevis]|uniref:Membrane protein DedA, SNARE-associated domain n=1 Tax=Sulfitobacter brevis TaxID=74348 RepID=A0A1I2DXE2_9RHOB|nr:DedA family protein [Sulfitobacter brevis]SFE84610.1 membrane protein DedA, SNARE-associated domain [Sulfitobacter brevis]
MFDWLAGIVEQGGYVAIAFLMLLENVFPPIPSELIMPLGGYLAQQGTLNPVLVVIAGSIGSLAGTTLWYYGARKLNRDRVYALIDRHGWWLTVTREGMEKAEERFKRHQGAAVFWGRMLPAIRTLISVPAGFARMSLWRFLALSMAGTIIWVSLLTAAGYLLGTQYDKVSGWINPVTNVLFGALAVLYVVRLLRGKGRK